MTDKWLERFQREALPEIIESFRPLKVLLFGSRAKGIAREDSDIDLIIISAFFEGIPFLKRMPLMLRKISFPKHIDYLCYTPEEYERIKCESAVLTDAAENSIEITA